MCGVNKLHTLFQKDELKIYDLLHSKSWRKVEEWRIEEGESLGELELGECIKNTKKKWMNQVDKHQENQIVDESTQAHTRWG